MTAHRETLKRCLLCYGADLRQWPQDVRNEGLKALADNPELQILVAEYQRLETFLHQRSYEQPAPDLAERIIATSLLQSRKEASPSLKAKFLEAVGWSAVRQPVVVALAFLAIASFVAGFIVGFASPTNQAGGEQTQVALQDYLYYKGELL